MTARKFAIGWTTQHSQRGRKRQRVPIVKHWTAVRCVVVVGWVGYFRVLITGERRTGISWSLARWWKVWERPRTRAATPRHDFHCRTLTLTTAPELTAGLSGSIVRAGISCLHSTSEWGDESRDLRSGRREHRPLVSCSELPAKTTSYCPWLNNYSRACNHSSCELLIVTENNVIYNVVIVASLRVGRLLQTARASKAPPDSQTHPDHCWRGAR